MSKRIPVIVVTMLFIVICMTGCGMRPLFRYNKQSFEMQIDTGKANLREHELTEV